MVNLKEEILGLFVDGQIKRKKQLLLSIIKRPKQEIVDLLKTLEFKPEFFSAIRDITHRFYYLKALHEYGSNDESRRAMKIMEENLTDICKIPDAKDKIILLKFIAVHSDKDASKKTIKMLVSYLAEVMSLNNSELKASTLRYLFIHSDEIIRKDILKKISEIDDVYVRDNSLDYIADYFKTH